MCCRFEILEVYIHINMYCKWHQEKEILKDIFSMKKGLPLKKTLSFKQNKQYDLTK